MAYDLGVDLGTTFAAAAVVEDGCVEMVSLADQAVVAPSAVYLTDNGALLFGEAAARCSGQCADRFDCGFKRHLGDLTPITLAGQAFPPQVLMAAQLRDVVAKVTMLEGLPPEHVAVTHPANWNPYRRKLLNDVAQLAGLTRYSTLTDPEAAAAFYATGGHLVDGDTIAVYDLGGGTFDAAVLRRTTDGIETVGDFAGIERLGGIDFDEAILEWVDRQSGGAVSDVDADDPQAASALTGLRQKCVLAKERLSVDAEVVISAVLPHRHLDVVLSRAQFERMIRPSVASTIDTLTRALDYAHVDVGRLAAVLVVGGSARIPLVARMLSEQLGRPVALDLHPKHAVALGAATVAAKRRAGTSRNVLSTGRRAPEGSPETTDLSESPRSRNVSGHLPVPRFEPSDDGEKSALTVRPRRTLVEVTAAAVAVVAFVGVLVGVIVHSDARRSGPSFSPVVPTGPAAATSSAASSAAVQPRAAVASPAVVTTIAVGPTPSFVVPSLSGSQLYVANPSAGTVTVVDTTTNNISAMVSMTAGPPRFLTLSPDGRRLYVSVWNDARTVAAISVLDTTNNTVLVTIPVLTRPYLSGVSRDGKKLYVPNHDSAVNTILDTAANAVVGQISMPPNPHQVEFSVDGTRAYSADHESNVISVIDTASDGVAASIPVGKSPHSLAVHPTRPLVANVNYDGNSVTMIDTRTSTVTATILVGRNPQHIRWSPDGRFAYAVNNTDNTVSVISAATNTVTATVPTGSSPTSIAVQPDGAMGYVTNLNGGSLTVLRLASNEPS